MFSNWRIASTGRTATQFFEQHILYLAPAESRVQGASDVADCRTRQHRGYPRLVRIVTWNPVRRLQDKHRASTILQRLRLRCKSRQIPANCMTPVIGTHLFELVSTTVITFFGTVVKRRMLACVGLRVNQAIINKLIGVELDLNHPKFIEFQLSH